MEGQNEQIPKQSPVVETVGKKMWEALVNIPVDREWANKMRSIADKMTARKFSNVREILHHNADSIGNLAKVGSAALDVALSVGCGAGVIKFGLDMKKNTQGINHVITHPELSVALQGQKPDLSSKNFDLKKNAIVFGGLGGTMLVVRLASRLAYYSAKLGGTVMERVAGAINTIALRSEKQPL